MIAKKRRGPAPTGKGIPVMVRLQPDMLSALDKFVDERGNISRPEAVRLILRDWMIGNGLLDNINDPEHSPAGDKGGE